jgi:PAS domain S-box-containing protein
MADINAFRNFTKDELFVMFNEMVDVFYRTDLEGYFVLLSPSVSAVFGYSEDELLGEKADSLYWEIGARENFVRALKENNGKIAAFEVQFRHKDGHAVWISVSSHYWRDVHGNILGIEGTARDISTQKKAEERLCQYEHILSTTDDLLALIDCNYRYLTVNDAYMRAHGKNRQDIVGHSVAELLGNEAFTGIVKGYLDRCLAGEIIQYQAWFSYLGGQKRYMDVTYHPYKNSCGQITAVTSSIHDITELRLALEARDKQREQLQNILDAIKDGIYVVNTDYEIEYTNNSIEEIFGTTHGEKCFEYLNNRTTPCSWCCLEKVLTGQSCSWQWESGKNGLQYEVIESPIVIEDGRMAKVSIFHDISKRLADEKQLRRNSHLFEAITNNTPAVIYLKRPQGEYFYTNDQFQKLFLNNAVEIKGRTDFDVFPAAVARQFQENDQKTLAEGKVSQVEEVVLQEGILHTYLSIKVPLFDEANKLWALAGISTDISDRKRMEGELQEKNEQLLSLINATPDIICFKDGEGRWLLANDANLDLFELKGVDYVGKKDCELAQFSSFYREAFLLCEESDEQAWAKGSLSRADEVIPVPHGPSRTYDVFKVPLFYADGRRKGLVVLGRDVTSRVVIDKALREEMQARQDALKELAQRNKDIKETNIALRVLLDQHTQTRENMEEQVLLQLEKLISPYLDLLRQRVADGEVRDYVDIITAHLATVTDSFIKNLNDPRLGLTDREMLVADLVRQGKSTQEIARLLGLAYRSVEAYRNSLRKKLKISNKKTNLRHYLLANFFQKS